MTYTNEQATEIIPALDDLAGKAKGITEEINLLQNSLQLYQDEALCKVYVAASKLVGVLKSVNDEIKRSRADWVRDAITGWYRDLHWDMHPAVEIAEEDVVDPEYESVVYKGHDEWEVIMATSTHGRELIVLRGCNGIDWTGVYSAERIDLPIPKLEFDEVE